MLKKISDNLDVLAIGGLLGIFLADQLIIPAFGRVARLVIIANAAGITPPQY